VVVHGILLCGGNGCIIADARNVFVTAAPGRRDFPDEFAGEAATGAREDGFGGKSVMGANRSQFEDR
jgi:hypothetical protein